MRWDDNTTAYPTEWKAIATARQYDRMLLYNLSADQSESHPVDVASVPRVHAFFSHVMATDRTEDPFWKSSQNSTDKCCSSCFSPTGCSYPCKQLQGSTSETKHLELAQPADPLQGVWGEYQTAVEHLKLKLL